MRLAPGLLRARLSLPLVALCLALHACAHDAADEAQEDAEVDPGDASLTADADGEPDGEEIEPIDDTGSDAGEELSVDSGSEADSGDSGRSDATGDGADACVASQARCLDPATIERCVAGQGDEPSWQRESCRANTTCQSDGVRTSCQRTGACQARAAVCSDSRTLTTCANGVFASQDCATRCLSTPLGAQCAPALATRTWQGRLDYERRRPNADLTDWDGALVHEPARGMLLLAYHGDVLVDVALSGSDDAGTGAFALQIPDPPGPEDSLVAMAAGADAHGELAYAVADPGFAPSATTLHASDEAMPDAKLWSWRFPLAGAPMNAALTIGESQGSGAALIFAAVRSVFLDGERFFQPSETKSLIAWLAIGTLWRCSACSNQTEIEHFGRVFKHQLRYDGSADQAYWSDAVTRHELGHYIMNAYGLSPHETGPHYFGEPTNPGQAWSEGWATFFSATERGSSIYYDKQDGGFFWFDIDARHYAFDDLVWQRPVAAKGLTQGLDENEVASMLWQAFESLADRAPFLQALAGARMTVPPFERGYLRRIWSDPDHPELYTETNVSAAHLADFFDAMRCANLITSSQLDAVTQPDVRYPYPSAGPLCR